MGLLTTLTLSFTTLTLPFTTLTLPFTGLTLHRKYPETSQNDTKRRPTGLEKRPQGTPIWYLPLRVGFHTEFAKFAGVLPSVMQDCSRHPASHCKQAAQILESFALHNHELSPTCALSRIYFFLEFRTRASASAISFSVRRVGGTGRKAFKYWQPVTRCAAAC